MLAENKWWIQTREKYKIIFVLYSHMNCEI